MTLARRAMHAVLRDEVHHSQLGWALLADQHGRGVPDCVGAHLPAMLDATVGDDVFHAALDPDPLSVELSGLGCLDLEASQHVVFATLDQVIFPGLARFGVDVTAGRRWVHYHVDEFLPAHLPSR